MQRAEHTACFAVAVAGLQAAEVGAPSCVGKQPSRLPALQRNQSVCWLLMSSEQPWFSGDDLIHLQGPLVFAGSAALAAAPGAVEHPVFHRAADRAPVTAAVGEHVLAVFLAEGIEAQAAHLLQVVAENEAVGVVVVGDDDVAGEHLAHQWLPKNCRNASCTWAGLRRPNSCMRISSW